MSAQALLSELSDRGIRVRPNGQKINLSPKEALKVQARKTAMRGGWEWYHPDDLPVKSEEDHEGDEEDQSQDVGPFGFAGPLRGDIDDSDEVKI